MLILPNMDVPLKFQEANLNRKKARKLVGQCEDKAQSAIQKFLMENQEQPLYPDDDESEDLMRNLWENKVNDIHGNVKFEAEQQIVKLTTRLRKYITAKSIDDCKKQLTDKVFKDLATLTDKIEQAEAAAREEKIAGVDSGDGAGSHAGGGNGSGSGVERAGGSHSGAGMGSGSSGWLNTAMNYMGGSTPDATTNGTGPDNQGEGSSTKLNANSLEAIYYAIKSKVEEGNSTAEAILYSLKLGFAATFTCDIKDAEYSNARRGFKKWVKNVGSSEVLNEVKNEGIVSGLVTGMGTFFGCCDDADVDIQGLSRYLEIYEEVMYKLRALHRKGTFYGGGVRLLGEVPRANIAEMRARAFGEKLISEAKEASSGEGKSQRSRTKLALEAARGSTRQMIAALEEVAKAQAKEVDWTEAIRNQVATAACDTAMGAGGAKGDILEAGAEAIRSVSAVAGLLEETEEALKQYHAEWSKKPLSFPNENLIQAASKNAANDVLRAKGSAEEAVAASHAARSCFLHPDEFYSSIEEYMRGSGFDEWPLDYVRTKIKVDFLTKTNTIIMKDPLPPSAGEYIPFPEPVALGGEFIYFVVQANTAALLKEASRINLSVEAQRRKLHEYVKCDRLVASSVEQLMSGIWTPDSKLVERSWGVNEMDLKLFYAGHIEPGGVVYQLTGDSDMQGKDPQYAYLNSYKGGDGNGHKASPPLYTDRMAKFVGEMEKCKTDLYRTQAEEYESMKQWRQSNASRMGRQDGHIMGYDHDETKTKGYMKTRKALLKDINRQIVDRPYKFRSNESQRLIVTILNSTMAQKVIENKIDLEFQQRDTDGNGSWCKKEVLTSFFEKFLSRREAEKKTQMTDEKVEKGEDMEKIFAGLDEEFRQARGDKADLSKMLSDQVDDFMHDPKSGEPQEGLTVYQYREKMVLQQLPGMFYEDYGANDWPLERVWIDYSPEVPYDDPLEWRHLEWVPAFSAPSSEWAQIDMQGDMRTDYYTWDASKEGEARVHPFYKSLRGESSKGTRWIKWGILMDYVSWPKDKEGKPSIKAKLSFARRHHLSEQQMIPFSSTKDTGTHRSFLSMLGFEDDQLEPCIFFTFDIGVPEGNPMPRSAWAEGIYAEHETEQLLNDLERWPNPSDGWETDERKKRCKAKLCPLPPGRARNGKRLTFVNFFLNDLSNMGIIKSVVPLHNHKALQGLRSMFDMHCGMVCAGFQGILTTITRWGRLPRWMLWWGVENFYGIWTFLLPNPFPKVWDSVCLDPPKVLSGPNNTKQVNDGKATRWQDTIQKGYVDHVRDYFGEESALLLGFLGFYQLTMTIPLLLGICAILVARYVNTDEFSLTLIPATWFTPFFSMAISIWAFCAQKLWFRRCTNYTYFWGSLQGKTFQEASRLGFKADEAERDYVQDDNFPFCQIEEAKRPPKKGQQLWRNCMENQPGGWDEALQETLPKWEVELKTNFNKTGLDPKYYSMFKDNWLFHMWDSLVQPETEELWDANLKTLTKRHRAQVIADRESCIPKSIDPRYKRAEGLSEKLTERGFFSDQGFIQLSKKYETMMRRTYPNFTVNVALYYPDEKRWWPLMVSFVFVTFMLVLVVVTTFALMALKLTAANYDKEHGYATVQLALLVGALQGVVNMIFDYVYRLIVRDLTYKENHRTERNHMDSLVIKRWVFTFINNYLSLFYIAFLKPMEIKWTLFDGAIEFEDKCTTTCFHELQTQVAGLVLIRFFLFGAFAALRAVRGHPVTKEASAFYTSMAHSEVRERGQEPGIAWEDVTENMAIQYLTKSSGHRWSPGVVTRKDETEGILHLLVRDPSSDKDMHRQLDRQLLSRLRRMEVEERLAVEDLHFTVTGEEGDYIVDGKQLYLPIWYWSSSGGPDKKGGWVSATVLNARRETRSIDIEFDANQANQQQQQHCRFNLRLDTHSHKIRVKKGDLAENPPPNLNSAIYRAGGAEENACGNSMFLGRLWETYYSVPAQVQEKVSMLEESSGGAGPKIEALRDAEDTTIDTYTDFALGFGFITMFAAAWPLAAAIIWVTNLFSIYSHKYRLLYTTRRPAFTVTKDIGIWHNILLFLTVMSVVTNLGIMSISSSTIKEKWLDRIDPNTSIELHISIAVIIEHIVLLIMYVVHMDPLKWFEPMEVRALETLDDFESHQKEMESRVQLQEFQAKERLEKTRKALKRSLMVGNELDIMSQLETHQMSEYERHYEEDLKTEVSDSMARDSLRLSDEDTQATEYDLSEDSEEEDFQNEFQNEVEEKMEMIEDMMFESEFFDREDLEEEEKQTQRAYLDGLYEIKARQDDEDAARHVEDEDEAEGRAEDPSKA